MDQWIISETKQRREELYAQAARARTLRRAESGRSSSIRGRIADGAESLSSVLAGLARVMRNHGA